MAKSLPADTGSVGPVAVARDIAILYLKTFEADYV